MKATRANLKKIVVGSNLILVDGVKGIDGESLDKVCVVFVALPVIVVETPNGGHVSVRQSYIKEIID